MDLNSAHEMSITLLENLGVRTPLFFSDITSLGACELIGGKPTRILLQTEFVLLNQPRAILDVVIHEAAHAKTGIALHDESWNDSYMKLGGNPDIEIILPPMIIGYCKRCSTNNLIAGEFSSLYLSAFQLRCRTCKAPLNPSDLRKATEDDSWMNEFSICVPQASLSPANAQSFSSDFSSRPFKKRIIPNRLHTGLSYFIEANKPKPAFFQPWTASCDDASLRLPS